MIKEYRGGPIAKCEKVLLGEGEAAQGGLSGLPDISRIAT